MKPPDWAIRCKSDEVFLDQGGLWDSRKGDAVKRHIERCCYDEAGERLQLYPFQSEIIDSWYSWIRPDGLPRAKIGWLTMARKNGKTGLLRGILSYSLVAAGYPSASVVSCAVNREQAGQIFDGLEWDRQCSADLRRVLRPLTSKKEMRYDGGNARYRSLSSNYRGNFGSGHDVCLFDEQAFQDDKVLACSGGQRQGEAPFQVVRHLHCGFQLQRHFLPAIHLCEKGIDGRGG
jgi:phage terminase large subunit-like protein